MNKIYNLPSAYKHPEVVTQKLSQESRLGRIAGPYSTLPIPNLVVSPIGIVPKKDPGKFRMIHHLSYPRGQSVNSGIDKIFTQVSYHSVDMAIDCILQLQSGVYFAKTDIESAFRIIPVHPRDHWLLGFYWDGNYYYDKMLPMGLSTSCQVFEKFSTAIQWAAQNHLNIKHMVHILDDFLIIPPSYQSCSDALQKFQIMCQKVGIPLAPNKTEGPKQVITFAGIELDSICMEARLPLEKLSRYQNLISQSIKRKRMTLRELQSLAGALNHCCYIVPAGRAFLRRLYDLTSHAKEPHHHIRLNNNIRTDLQMWNTFLQEFNGKSLFLQQGWHSNQTLNLYTDAAKTVGFGAILGNEWFSGIWPSQWKQYDITILEFYPIVIALHLWANKLSNKRIILYTDNEAVMHILNNNTSKDKALLGLIRALVLQCLKFNIVFRSEHVPGQHNVLADLLSRSQLQAFYAKAPMANKNPTQIPECLLPNNWSLD